MLQYLLAGLALGSIYAIASSGLVVTFVSAGVLNFAFGAMAYFVARFYYWLNSQHGWGTDTSGFVAIAIVGPLTGVVLYGLLFRFLRGKSSLVKLVSTIGLSVALPELAQVLFNNDTITSAPGLAALSSDNHPWHIFGTPVTQDQVITYGFLLFVVVVGTFVLRFTDVGLRVRALVDSEAMASLSGTNPGRVAVGVWAVSSGLAGLAGILAAPSQGLDTEHMTGLMAASFAAVVGARLRSLPLAVIISLLMGVVTDVIQKWLPPNSSFTADLIPSIPFGFILIALIFYLVRSGNLHEDSGVAGPLDSAIKPAQLDSVRALAGTVGEPVWSKYLGLGPLAIAAAVPLIFHGTAYWLTQTGVGICYAIIFLTFTLVTGEGGMLWLSQIIFAGTGALTAGQFTADLGVPVLLSILIGAVVAAIAGAIIGLLTIRLGDLYVALVTLTFGLLIEGLVFTLRPFARGGLGVNLNPPSFAHSQLVFAYMAFAVFCVLALFIVNLRRSTSGMALLAVRDSEAASRTLGLSVLQVKVIVGSLAAFVAAIGGGFWAMSQASAQPQSYETFLGLVWLAVVVTLGVRSITAAMLAGLSYVLLTAVFSTYVPSRWSEVPPLLFGLGAIGVARNPDGAVLQASRQLRGVLVNALSKPQPVLSIAGGPGGFQPDPAGSGPSDPLTRRTEAANGAAPSTPAGTATQGERS